MHHRKEALLDYTIMIHQVYDSSSTRILTIIIREIGNPNTHIPLCCMKDSWENWLNLGHTLDRMYLRIILKIQ